MFTSTNGADSPFKMETVGERDEDRINVWVVKDFCSDTLVSILQDSELKIVKHTLV